MFIKMSSMGMTSESNGIIMAKPLAFILLPNLTTLQASVTPLSL